MRPEGTRDPVVGPENGPEAPFPLQLDGEVVKGFGRGSKDVSILPRQRSTLERLQLIKDVLQLGIPTANIPIDGLTVGGHSDIESGVYYGWAGLSPSNETTNTGMDMQKLEHTRDTTTNMFGVTVGESNGDGEHVSQTSTQNKGTVYPMVMSIGWNPFYKNTVRSVEVHIMHNFDKDFYGSHMNLAILGFIRPEYDYVSKESLIEDIKTDIDVARNCLARPAYAKYKNDKSLLDFAGKGKTAS